VRAVVDSLHIYGEGVNTSGSSPFDKVAWIAVLGEDVALRRVATEGLCKLILANLAPSAAQMLAILLFAWFDLTNILVQRSEQQ